jgi:hypothetical protein
MPKTEPCTDAAVDAARTTTKEAKATAETSVPGLAPQQEAADTSVDLAVVPWFFMCSATKCIIG